MTLPGGTWPSDPSQLAEAVLETRPPPRGGPALSGESAVRGRRSLWTSRRVRLQAALSQLDELSADLYRRAVDALDEGPLVIGSLVIAGHCIRDLVNRLPDVLTDVELVPAYSDMVTPARVLSEVWASHTDLLGSAEAAATERPSGESEPKARVTVPAELVHAARIVVTASRAGAINARCRHSALVLGRIEVRHDPTVKLFRDSVSVFERLRHPQRGREIAVAGNLDRLEKPLEVIENVLEGRLGSFFQTVEELTDVLEAANRRDEVDQW